MGDGDGESSGAARGVGEVPMGVKTTVMLAPRAPTELVPGEKENATPLIERSVRGATRGMLAVATPMMAPSSRDDTRIASFPAR